MIQSPPIPYETVFDVTDDEVVILDADGVIVDVNLAWKRFCDENGGDAKSYYIGTNYLTTCRTAFGPSDTEASVVEIGISKVLAEGGAFRCEYPCHSPTIERWFELKASSGKIAGSSFAVVTHRNISTRYVQQMAARDAFYQAQMLATLVANSNDAILSYDLDGKIITWNRAAQKLYGYSPEEALGQSIWFLFTPDLPASSFKAYRDKVVAGDITGFEAVRMDRDGRRIDVWVTCSPLRGPDGAIEAISGIHRDITVRKQLEQVQSLVAHEVTHRAKNMLSVVNAIQRQTARSSRTIAEFSEKFSQRISSLVASTDSLVHGDWKQVSLQDLLVSQFDLFDSIAADRFVYNGPSVDLLPQAAQAVGMALHELLTNSLKHGVLSSSSGTVEVSWALETRSDDKSLILVWLERGTPFHTEPTRQGFGHTVLTKLAKSMIKGESSLHFDLTGLRWTISIPAQHFVDQ